MNIHEFLKNEKITNIQEEILKEIQYNNLGLPIISDDGVDIARYINVPLGHKATVDDYILVHGTNYFPKNGMISSSQKKRVMEKLNQADWYGVNEYAYYDRNTIHFAVNGYVSDHSSGTFSGRPYIVLDPMKNHIDQIITLRPEDTFTYGSVFLSKDVIILIDESKFSKIYKEYKDEIDKNKNHIVLFRGNGEKVVQKMLILLGYKPRIIGEHSFFNNFDDAILNIEFKEMADNYPEKNQRPHVSSSSSRVEKRKFYRDIGLNTIRNTDGNYSNDIIISLEELYQLYDLFCNKGLHNGVMTNHFDITNESAILEFIINYGVSIHDNEIHLLGTKEMIEREDMIKEREDGNLGSQVQKCKLLFQKYEYLKMYENKKNERLEKIQERRELLQSLGKNINKNTGIEISFDEYFRIFIMTQKINCLGIYRVDYLNNKVYLCSDAYLHIIDSEEIDEELYNCIKQYVSDNNIQDENILSIIDNFSYTSNKDWNEDPYSF